MYGAAIGARPDGGVCVSAPRDDTCGMAVIGVSGRVRVAAALALVICAATSAGARAATIVVTSTGDDTAVDGSVSLREAIESIDAGANIDSDVVASGAYGTADTILFDIPSAGTHTISPTVDLPPITRPLTIDATSQPGFAAAPVIVLDGSSDGAVSPVGLDARAAVTIEGLDVVGFGGTGIDLDAGSAGSIVSASRVGINAAGAGAGANGMGIAVRSGGDVIGPGNVVSGNLGAGVMVAAGVTAARITATFIGTNAAGAAALANGGDGISIEGSGVTVGGAALADGNVISGNGADGILVSGASASRGAR